MPKPPMQPRYAIERVVAPRSGYDTQTWPEGFEPFAVSEGYIYFRKQVDPALNEQTSRFRTLLERIGTTGGPSPV